MGVLRVVGGLFKSFFGIGSGGTSPVKVIADVVDEYKYTEQEQAEDATKRGQTDAEYTAKMMIADSRSGTSPFDIIVDALNRLQRPAWGAYLFGGLIGLWQFTDFRNLDPVWGLLFVIYFTALFGGRTIAKDLAATLTKLSRR